MKQKLNKQKTVVYGDVIEDADVTEVLPEDPCPVVRIAERPVDKPEPIEKEDDEA